MSIKNSSDDVLIYNTGIELYEFTNRNANNLLVYNDMFYIVTSSSKKLTIDGSIYLTLQANCVGNLDSRINITCITAAIQYGSAGDTPRSNMYLSLKGVSLYMTGHVVSEIIAPMVGDFLTQIHYKGNGCTWNSKHPGTNLQGSTIVFEAGGDGHLGKHPDATIKDVKMIWKATSRNEFVLGMHPNWKNNKPSPMENLRFISVSGNDYISFFSWANSGTPADVNNAFLVNPDWIYDVALPNTKPDSLRRSYRRGNYVTATASYWNGKTMSPMYLWIDPKTTIENGIIDQGETYIKKIDYSNNVGTSYADNTSDIIAFRFKPEIQQPDGNKLFNVKVVVINKTYTKTEVGTFDTMIAVSGVTNEEGKMYIVEPATKDYYTATSYLTDSCAIKARNTIKIYHKWWEEDTKYVIVHDSRNTLGSTNGVSYNDFEVNYRKEGYVFVKETYAFDKPYEKTVNMAIDKNYNNTISTSTITITYVNNVTTVTLPNTDITLDAIYKKVIDFHGSISSTESNTYLPLSQDVEGWLKFDNNLILDFKTNTKIIAGTLITKLETTQNLVSNQSKLSIVYKDSNGYNLILKTNLPIFQFMGKQNNVISSYAHDLEFKHIVLSSTETIECIVGAYGYKPRYLSLNINSNMDIYLEKYTFTNFSISNNVNTIINLLTMDLVGDYLVINVLADLKNYLANEILSAIELYIHYSSYNFYKFMLTNQTDNVIGFEDGKLLIYSNKIFVKLSDNVTTHLNKGYTFPVVTLAMNYTTGLMTTEFEPVKLNSSNILLRTPDWVLDSVGLTDDTYVKISDLVWKYPERTITQDLSGLDVDFTDLENKIDVLNTSITELDVSLHSNSDDLKNVIELIDDKVDVMKITNSKKSDMRIS